MLYAGMILWIECAEVNNGQTKQPIYLQKDYYVIEKSLLRITAGSMYAAEIKKCFSIYLATPKFRNYDMNGDTLANMRVAIVLLKTTVNILLKGIHSYCTRLQRNITELSLKKY